MTGFRTIVEELTETEGGYRFDIPVQIASPPSGAQCDLY